MNKETVDSIMAGYRENKARCEHLSIEIGRMNIAFALEQGRALEAAALHAQTYDGMPHGNAVSSPVENLVLGSGTTPMLHEIKTEIGQLQDELKQKSMLVRYVDGWLLCLNDREREIIQRHMLDGVYWRDVLREYRQSHDSVSTVEALRRIQRIAMNKIYASAR